ncbi:hypothetical protein SO694_00083061 [Aureococcus anophagefferens]|uniref:Uncharacterized protein n=1 Tax=Aureococcus anophagefferens TaxID=44056 RepID=A0ABR1FJ96_AURAN
MAALLRAAPARAKAGVEGAGLWTEPALRGLVAAALAPDARGCLLAADIDEAVASKLPKAVADFLEAGADAFGAAASRAASSDGETRESSGGTDDARLSSPGDVARKARGGALRLYGRSRPARARIVARPAAAAAAVAANFFAGAGDGDDGAPAALAAAVALGFPAADENARDDVLRRALADLRGGDGACDRWPEAVYRALLVGEGGRSRTTGR